MASEGWSRDAGLAASAHFNLGTLAAGEAGRLAGEHPENVAPAQEILDQLRRPLRPSSLP
jgi:hypothetical protein